MLNLKGLLKVLPLVLLLPVSQGCVSKAEHETLRQQYEQLSEEKNAAAADCEESVQGLVQQLADLDEQNAALSEQAQALGTQVEELARAREELLESSRASEELREQMILSLQEELGNREARVEQRQDTLTVEVVEKLMFDSGSAQISPRGAKMLAKIGPVLASAVDKEILVVGHADDLPPSASLARKYPSNWELSAARAAAIVHVLIWGQNLPPERMIIEGAAHYHPLSVFDNDLDEYRRSNRVVEIILRPVAK